MVDGDILVPDPTTGWEKRRSLALEMDATAARPKRGNGEGGYQRRMGLLSSHDGE